MIITLIYGTGFVLGTVGLIFAAYFLMRMATGGEEEGQTRDLAGSVIFRVSALHGLILALVFAQQMVEYQKLKYESVQETNALADIFFDIERYGTDVAVHVRGALREYTRIVVDEEWEHLGKTGLLIGAAWAQWDVVYNAVLDLEPVTERQKSLRDHMLEKIHSVAETRDARENHGSGSISKMFWFAAISGVFLIALAYYPYPPNVHNLFLISVFGAFTGIVLLFIFAFANPFSEPGSLGPDVYQRLLESEIVNMTPQPPGA